MSVPEHFNWGFDVIDRWAREKPQLLSLVYTDDDGRTERRTFREISEQSSRIANLLAKNGIGRGDAVLVMLPNVAILWSLVVALFKVGATIVPSASGLAPKDIEYRVTKANIRGVVTSPDNVGKFTGVLAERPGPFSFLGVTGPVANSQWNNLQDAERESSRFPQVKETKSSETAIIYFTSGTEGLPKMVLHTHASYPLGHRVTALWLGLREGQLHWNISSPGWAKHAWSSIFAPWNVGAATVAYNGRGPFSAAKHLQKMVELGVNSVCGSPTVWRMIMLEDLSKYDLSSIASATSAGEPLNPEVIERFKKATGVTIRDGYGQTETVLAVGNFPGVKIKPGSMGLPSPLYDIEVVDSEGRVQKPKEEGHVAIRITPERPFALLSEYSGDPQRNDEAFRNGWYYTGDRGFKDEDGYFWYVGRADDVVKSSGYRVGPFEVESALVKHPAVVEAAVVSSPDPVRGAILKAYVVLRPGHAASEELANELGTFVARETAPYKHPRKIEFVESLDPVKTISGKIRRKALREAEYGKGEKQVSGTEFTLRPLRDTA